MRCSCWSKPRHWPQGWPTSLRTNAKRAWNCPLLRYQVAEQPKQTNNWSREWTAWSSTKASMFTWNVSVRIHSLLYTVCSLTCSYANKYFRGSLTTTTKRGMKSFQLRKWRNSQRIHPQKKNTTLESKNSNDSDLKNANTKLVRIWLENQILQIRSLGCCHSWQTLASIRTIPGTQQKIDAKKFAKPGCPGTWSYCWWKKSCTSWYGEYPTICRVLYIPGGAGFLPSTVVKQPVTEPICSCHSAYQVLAMQVPSERPNEWSHMILKNPA